MSLTYKPGTVDYLSLHLREEPQFRALLRAVESTLWEQAGELPQPVLDIGCGDGQYAQVTFVEPLTSGIDPLWADVRQARDRGTYQQIVLGSAMAMPYPDGRFATAVSNSSVEHIPDVHSTLSETARVLQPGGRFVFCVPSHRFAEMLLVPTLLRRLGAAGLSKAYEDWFNTHSAHFHLYNHTQWQVLLDEHGFDLEHYEYYFTARAHRVFDILHYLGVPRLISHTLTGRWVLIPELSLNFLFKAWLRPLTRHYAPDGPYDEGPYLFLHARKR